MKKFYLFAALALAASATMSAKELSFFVKGEKVTPGTNVSIECLKITVDYGADGKDYEYNPELFILSDVDASDLVVSVTCTSGQELSLCCGGECEMGTTVTKSNVSIQAGEKLDAEFHCLGDTNSADEKIPNPVVSEISAFFASDPSSEIKFTLTMKGTDASVSSVLNSAEVLETRWYNLQGMRMQEQPEGIALKWERLSDGTVRTSRELNRR